MINKISKENFIWKILYIKKNDSNNLASFPGNFFSFFIFFNVRITVPCRQAWSDLSVHPAICMLITQIRCSCVVYEHICIFFTFMWYTICTHVYTIFVRVQGGLWELHGITLKCTCGLLIGFFMGGRSFFGTRFHYSLKTASEEQDNFHVHGESGTIRGLSSVLVQKPTKRWDIIYHHLPFPLFSNVFHRQYR